MIKPLKADVIIIGAGATGLAAAVSAAENGAKVIVLEKRKVIGGTGNFFDGVFGVESYYQRNDFTTYTKDQAFKYIMEYSHWLANPRLVRAIVDEAGDTIKWLEDNGVEFYGAMINLPDSPRTYHVVKGHGAAAMKALAKQAKSLGVDIMLATPVIELIKKGKTVVGVVAEKGKEKITIEAPSVIIGSGGYMNNEEWVKKYTGMTIGETIFPIGSVGKMGDGIRMAWEAGAAEEGTGVIEMFSMGPVGPNFKMKNIVEHISMQPDLWVNVQGERFCDEAVTFFDTTVGNVNSKMQDGKSYRLFDTEVVRRLMEDGLDKNGGMERPPGSTLKGLDKELKVQLKNMPEDLFEAKSIKELAEKLNIKPSVLEATVKEYNEFCAKGHDDLFAKDRRWLRPLVGPKYYAVVARTVGLGTKGGIKINEKMEVIDKEFNIIPGLYAGGFDAGGLYGDSYTIAGSSGLSSGFALNSGRIAGRNAARFARKKSVKKTTKPSLKKK